MVGDHKILEVTESLFAAGGRHSCLWPEATRFNKSQIPASAGTPGHIRRDGQLNHEITDFRKYILLTICLNYTCFNLKIVLYVWI